MRIASTHPSTVHRFGNPGPPLAVDGCSDPHQPAAVFRFF
jgi:hypothetical protein